MNNIKTEAQLDNSAHMTVNTKYVITNTDHLISPKGHSLLERTFIQTDIAIHCDEIPKKLPKTRGGLYAHNIDDMMEKHKKWMKA